METHWIKIEVGQYLWLNSHEELGPLKKISKTIAETVKGLRVKPYPGTAVHGTNGEAEREYKLSQFIQNVELALILNQKRA